MKKIFTIGMVMMFLAVFAGMSFAQDNSTAKPKRVHTRPAYTGPKKEYSKKKFVGPRFHRNLNHKPAGSASAPVTVR